MYNRERNRLYQARWYKKNKKLQMSRTVERRKRIRKSINNLKSRKPCKDCKKYYPAVCMDFDHVKGKKLFTISTHYANVSIRDLKNEIKKCELVCSNCHRIRTHKKRKLL